MRYMFTGNVYFACLLLNETCINTDLKMWSYIFLMVDMFLSSNRKKYMYLPIF